jgi:hypothetical protein
MQMCCDSHARLCAPPPKTIKAVELDYTPLHPPPSQHVIAGIPLRGFSRRFGWQPAKSSFMTSGVTECINSDIHYAGVADYDIMLPVQRTCSALFAQPRRAARQQVVCVGARGWALCLEGIGRRHGVYGSLGLGV